MAFDTDIHLRNKVIYSIYVRNYSREGTFKAVECDLERIRELGVDIIWLLPIHPTGIVSRKGTLGSPYAIQDYRKINSEYGTMEDFISLVDAIHALGMKCMIDVVYNHTSPDSWLARSHPEYFYKTEQGTMGNKVGDWADIVDLDYSNQSLWNYQIETLKMWAKIVDGFRCDVAPLVPLEFWLRARTEVGKVNSGCIWLSESVESELILDFRSKGLTCLSDSEILQVFDICYDYDIFKYFRDYLQGKGTLEDYISHLNMQEYIYPDNYIKLRYLENHDQDRIKKWVVDEAILINWTAFLYFQKGTTLLYAGQETENDFRPDLFNRDTVLWNSGKNLTELMKNLYQMKNEIFLNSSYWVSVLGQGIVLGRHKEKRGTAELIGIFSMEGNLIDIKLDIPDGDYINYVNHDTVIVRDGRMQRGKEPVIIKTK